MAAFVYMSPLDTKHHLVDHPSSTTAVSSATASTSTSSVLSSFFSKFTTPCSTSSSLLNSSNSVVSGISSSDLDSSATTAAAMMSHPVKHLELDSPTSPEPHCMVKKIKSIFSTSATVNNTNQSTILSSSSANSSLLTTTSTNSTIQSASSSSTSTSKCSLLKLLSNETSLFNKCDASSSSLSPGGSCFIDALELKNKFLNLANQFTRDFFIIMLDCRSFSDFNSKRIKDSIHVNCRDKLSKKRLMTRKITVRDLISSSLTCESLRSRFDLNNNTNATLETLDENSSSSEDSQPPIATTDENNLIILYDDTTSDLTDLQSESNPLKIVQDNIKHTGPKNGCKILKGGFKQFSEICPEYVEEVLKLNSNQANSKYYEYQPDQNQSSIENAKMTKIESFLYLGNESDARNVSRLEQEGIYYVLNVTKNIPFYDDLVPTSSKSKFVFKRIGVNDSCDQNLRKHFDEAIEFIDEAVRNECKVLVHCQAGVSRSPTIVIAYLMHKYKMRMNDAYTRVRDMRSIVAPNLIFIGQLMDYESKLFPTMPLTSCASSFTFASTASTTSIANTNSSSTATPSPVVVGGGGVNSTTGFNLTISADTNTTTTNTEDSESQKTAIACN